MVGRSFGERTIQILGVRMMIHSNMQYGAGFGRVLTSMLSTCHTIWPRRFLSMRYGLMLCTELAWLLYTTRIQPIHYLHRSLHLEWILSLLLFFIPVQATFWRVSSHWWCQQNDMQHSHSYCKCHHFGSAPVPIITSKFAIQQTISTGITWCNCSNSQLHYGT